MRKSLDKTALMKIQVSKNQFCQLIFLPSFPFLFYFLKKSLQYIPLVRLLEFFLMERGESNLAHMLEYFLRRWEFWVFLFVGWLVFKTNAILFTVT